MKKNFLPTNVIMAAACAAACLTGVSNSMADGAKKDAETRFPYVIQYELGASGFSAGDQITITSVRGDRKHIEPGGSFLVEGSYTLGSAASADLALFCTTRGPSGPTPIQDGQRIKISRGSGIFHLYETNLADGWLHVSFYPENGDSHGGVYFGEKGREDSIMRNRDWFREFDAQSETTFDAAYKKFEKLLKEFPATANKRDEKIENLFKELKSMEESSDIESGQAGKGNRALIAYLGNPVPAPADMDSLYNRENLLKAFTAMCQKGDLVLTKLAVDDSEFPFLIYGTLDGSHTLPNHIFEGMTGYTYGGCVRGSSGDGATYFAVNIVPSSQYPKDQEKACNRRLMIRLQMLAEQARQTIDR